MSSQITFDEIRKGDRLRLDYPVEFGVKVIREAVAHERHGLAWHTPDGGYIVGPLTTATITLLHRSGPAEPKFVGAVIRAAVDGADGHKSILARAPGEGSHPWVDAYSRYEWDDFDPDSIEVLRGGIEVES